MNGRSLACLSRDEGRLRRGPGPRPARGDSCSPVDDQVVDRAARRGPAGAPSRAARPGRRRASGRAGCGGPARPRRSRARRRRARRSSAVGPARSGSAVVGLEAGPAPGVGRGEARQGLGVRRGLAGDGEPARGVLEVQVGLGDAEQGVVGRRPGSRPCAGSTTCRAASGSKIASENRRMEVSPETWAGPPAGTGPRDARAGRRGRRPGTASSC